MLSLIMFVATLASSPFDVTPSSPPAVIAAADEAAVDSLGDAFFGKLKAQKYIDAYSDALSSPLMRKRSTEVEQAASTSESAFKIYGPIVDWEQIAEQNVTQTFVRRYYVARTENLPVFFCLEYYSIKGKWSMVNITFWDRFQDIR